MKLRQFLALALAGALLGMLVASIWKWQQQTHPVEADQSASGKTLPDFTLPNIDGSQWRAEEWRNRILVINFWATWCPPCTREMPIFNRLQQDFADRDVVFVGIAVDDAEAVKKFVREKGIGFPVLLGETRAMDLMVRLGNRFNALPFTIVVDHGGRVILQQFGELDEQELRSLLEKVTQGH
ncbi:TlpA family protein disulfide reductase [Thiolapillus sp.]